MLLVLSEYEINLYLIVSEYVQNMSVKCGIVRNMATWGWLLKLICQVLNNLK
jgi:hypothetical protein